jgi:hypothetical protein
MLLYQNKAPIPALSLDATFSEVQEHPLQAEFDLREEVSE